MTWVQVGSLTRGDFAITEEEDMAVLCLSSQSFSPKEEFSAMVVNLATGVGNFPKGTMCRKVTLEEAVIHLLRVTEP
jgi:hypothetical protein